MGLRTVLMMTHDHVRIPHIKYTRDHKRVFCVRSHSGRGVFRVKSDDALFEIVGVVNGEAASTRTCASLLATTSGKGKPDVLKKIVA